MEDNMVLVVIEKTREYLDYIEGHILNINKAWAVIQNNCSDMRFIYDDYVFNLLDQEIKRHDYSKLSEHEFIQYRKALFPTKFESKYNMQDAWKHHKARNPHHWENWTKKNNPDLYETEISCVHMIVDWMAMGYKFGDTPRSYYEKNKDKISIPKKHIHFMYEIFNRLEVTNDRQ